MTLPAAYSTISLNDVRIEAGLAQAGINLNNSTVRTLAGVGGSGTVISMNNLHGKSSYTPMSGSAHATYVDVDSQFSAGTITGFASVNVSGGNPSKTYSWTVTSNPGGCTVTGLTNATPTVSKAYSRYQTMNHVVTLTCVINDGTGSITVTGNTVTLNTYDGRN